MRYYSLFAFFFWSFSLGATQNTPWLENMQQKLPNALCQPDQYFMKCFSLTQAECLQLANQYTQACVQNTAAVMPSTLNAEEAKHWSQVVGRCTYDLFEKFTQPKKRHDIQECTTLAPRPSHE